MEISDAKKKEVEQLVAGFLKLKTQKECERTALNELKLDTQWRLLMREAKSKELQDDLHMMRQSFLKVIDYKDAMIAALEVQLEQIEVQNMWSTLNHMQTLENLIEIEQQRSQNLLHQYEKDLEELKKVYEEARAVIEAKFNADESWFKELSYIEESIFKETSEKIELDFTLLQEDIKERVSNETDDITRSFDCNVKQIWRTFQAVLLKYLEDVASKEKSYKELMVSYEESMKNIEQDIAVNEELKQSIPQLKAQIEERKKDHNKRLEQLSLGNKGFFHAAADIKDKIAKLQKHDKASLTELVINSSAAIKVLQRLVSKGEKIMKLYDHTLKLEEECGNFLCDDVLLTPEEIEKVKEAQITLPQNLNLDESCKYMCLLNHFWRRHSKVKLKNLALQQELDELEHLSLRARSNLATFFKQVANKEPEEQLTLEAKPIKRLVQEAALMKKSLPKVSSCKE